MDRPTVSVYEGHGVTLHHGDCLDVLRTLPDASVDSVVTDPPYGLEFMGKSWDGADGFRRSLNANDAGRDDPFGRTSRTSPEYRAGALFQRWCEAWATECLRVLKPGGHLLAFGGTRTWHRLACAVEDAGFEVRDSIAWMYGSGFPKSMDVSKAIDKAAGATREKVRKTGAASAYSANAGNDRPWMQEARENGFIEVDGDIPATDAAREWEGWGTALKPAFEPVVVARKPLAGTVAANVLAHGTGALNIDGCRVEGPKPDTTRGASVNASSGPALGGQGRILDDGKGRWPANVVLDESQAEALDEQSGESVSKAGGSSGTHFSAGDPGVPTPDRPRGGHTDTGGASRFFYVAKADASERPRVNGTAHPTVKPLDLMRWLVRLVTPPGGTVLEPFAGSGTTVEACIVEGFQCIAIEREADYLPLIRQRIDRRRDPVEALRGQAADLGLFDLLGGEGA